MRTKIYITVHIVDNSAQKTVNKEKNPSRLPKQGRFWGLRLTFHQIYFTGQAPVMHSRSSIDKPTDVSKKLPLTLILLYIES